MAVAFSKSYIFEDFRLEPEKRVLSRNSVQMRLASRPFQVLLYLIENRERFVSRGEILEKFWDGRDVYDTAVTKCIGAIRKALDENPEKPRFIETRWAEGYRFIGQVEEFPESMPAFFEIERTREVRILIEEEGVEPINEKIISPVLPQPLPGDSAKRFSRSALAVMGSLAGLLLAAAAIMFSVSGNPVQNQPVQLNSIAVLPFKTLSNNPEREIFSDGLAENLIGSLSKIEGLKVISGNTVSAYKGKDAVDPREIGNRLGVTTVLEGSVRENGERLRIEVRLVSTADRQILWSSEGYDRTLGDVFEIQDDIARNVATRLRLKLSTADRGRLAKRQTSSVEAYQAYLKGRYFWKKKDAVNMEKARRFFEEAINIDPYYALAYTGLVDYYTLGIWYAALPKDQANEAAKQAALKAVKLDPELPQAYAGLGRIAVADWDWAGNRKYLERAIELDPNDANSWQGYAFALLNTAGQKEEALAAIRRAQELDPLSRSINLDVGVMLTHLERYDEAVAVFEKTLETEPDYYDAYWNLGRALERKGDYRRAVDAFIENARLNGTSQERLAALRDRFERAGINGFWQKKLEFAKKDGIKNPDTHCWIAAMHARLGEKDLALEHLEKAYILREPLMVNLKSEYFFDSLRSDARFEDLIRRVGLEK